MEGLIACGVGGLIVSTFALWHGRGGKRAYLEYLKSAPAGTRSAPEGALVHVTGRTHCAAPVVRPHGVYAKLWEEVYALTLVRKLHVDTQGGAVSARTTTTTLRDLLTSNKWVAEAPVTIFDGDNIWDVTTMVDAMDKAPAKETPGSDVVPPRPAQDHSFAVDLKTLSGSAETERTPQGTVTVARGIPLEEHYTVFGCVTAPSPGQQALLLLPCPRYGALVFRHMSAAQAIASEEEALHSWNWGWRLAGYVSGAAVAVGMFGSFASKQ